MYLEVLMNKLPQLIHQIATDADFRVSKRVDPRTAATRKGLTYRSEEWAVLMEWPDLCSIGPANDERKAYIELPQFDWGIGVPFTYATATT
jgi:hypothetical protein